MEPDDAPDVFRLQRRFVLQGVGVALLVSGLVLAVAINIRPLWLGVVGLVVAAAMFGRALLLWWRPPPVAQLDDEGMTIGGRLTVRPVRFAWTDVEDVSREGRRLTIDRGGETLLAFPLQYVGDEADALVRAIYDRLNAAHGYRRFDPDQA